MSNLLDLTQINGENPTKFITTDASNKIQAAYDFTSSTVPFNNSATSIVATNVEAAIKETYALAAAITFTNPMLVDLIFANTKIIKAQNGTGELNLRDGVDSTVSLKGGTGKLTISSVAFGLTDTGTFTATDNYFVVTTTTSEAKWNTTCNKLSMRIDGNGLGVKFDKSLDFLGQIFGNYNGIFLPTLEFANNVTTAYTTPSGNRPIVSIGASNVVLGAGIKNSVALGGGDYTISENNTAYVTKLAFGDSTNRILFVASVLSSATINVPSDNGVLALRGTLSTGKVSYWDSTSKNFIDSPLITDGTFTGVGVISSGSLFNVETTTQALGLRVQLAYTLGNNEAAYIQAVGVSGSINTAIKANANGGSSNYALIASATGTGAVGVRIDNGGLLVGATTYSSASIIAEFVSTNKAIVVTKVVNPAVDIATPTAGMIVYNTTTNKHQGYDGTIWNDLY